MRVRRSGYYSEEFGDLLLATHRWYNPALNRWLNRDPVGYDGGENLHEYAESNPVRYFDPDGLEVEEIQPPGQSPIRIDPVDVVELPLRLNWWKIAIDVTAIMFVEGVRYCAEENEQEEKIEKWRRHLKCTQACNKLKREGPKNYERAQAEYCSKMYEYFQGKEADDMYEKCMRNMGNAAYGGAAGLVKCKSWCDLDFRAPLL